jgi:hypothetical protein
MIVEEQTVWDCLRRQFKLNRVDGDVGIEIETEAKKPYIIPDMRFWRVDKDGSLRNFGQEYILRGAVKRGQELEDALQEFDDVAKEIKFLESIYTSVHVHLNFLNDKWITLANFITAYALLEPSLVKYSGPTRESNLFCLSIRDAEGCLDAIKTVLAAADVRRYDRMALHPDHVKYSALNMANLYKLGTLEVRSFRGVHDVKCIKKWVDILLSIKDYASAKDLNPVKVIEEFRADTPAWVRKVLGGSVEEFPDIRGVVESAKENLWYGAKIATVCKDWAKFGVLIKEPQPKELMIGALDELSMRNFRKLYRDLNFPQMVVLEELFYQQNPGILLVDAEGDM